MAKSGTVSTVYEPQEDSYLLEKEVKRYACGDVLEIGTGSGIQAIAAAQNRKVKNVLAVDINPAAIAHCRKKIKDKKSSFRISDLFSKVGKKKFEVEAPFKNDEAYAYLKEWALPTITKAIKDQLPKLTRRAIFNGFIDGALQKLEEKYGANPEAMAELSPHAKDLMDKVIKGEMRRLILDEGIRMSSRKIEEIRPIGVMVDPLPNFVHGSALFQRGETQGLTTCTLGSPGDKQLVEGMEGEVKQRYMHHYNFPPFSVGETSNRLFVGNREIGHGNLAQRAIEPVLPTQEIFP